MRAIFFSLGLGLAIFYGGPAIASICGADDFNIKSEYQNSDYVIVGKVVSIGNKFKKYYKIESVSTYDEYTKITIKVRYMIKGSHRNIIEFYNTDDSARLPVKVGEVWLLFLYKTRDWQHVSVDNCGASGNMSEQKTIRTLEALKK